MRIRIRNTGETGASWCLKTDPELQNPQGGPAGGESPLWHAHQAEEESLQGMLTSRPFYYLLDGWIYEE